MLDQNNMGNGDRVQIAARNYRAYPDNLEAAVTYAWTLFLSGYEKEADEIFGPILSSGQMTATVAYYLAEIANRREDKSLANTLLKLALSQKSNFPKRIAALELKALLEEESENNIQIRSTILRTTRSRRRGVGLESRTNPKSENGKILFRRFP